MRALALMLLALTAGPFLAQPAHAGIAGYSVTSLYIGNALYAVNTTDIRANFTGINAADPRPGVVFNMTLRPSLSGNLLVAAYSYRTCGFNCTTVVTPVTLNNTIPEGSYYYRWQIGAWHSDNKTVDVIQYSHFLFIDYQGVETDAITAAKQDGVDVSDAQQLYNVASGLAIQANRLSQENQWAVVYTIWPQAFSDLIGIKPLIQGDYARAGNMYWGQVTVDITLIVGILSPFFAIYGVYEIRRRRRRREMREREAKRKA